MPGPLSTPNGDTRIIRGHVNEVFMCEKHNTDYDSHNEEFNKDGELLCRRVSLREYLLKRNRLVTGKTK